MPSVVISILNMKGGVGKTTISANVFRHLYQRFQKRVLLVDLDPQFNLTQSVMTRARYDTCVSTSRTIISCFEPAPADDFFAVKKSDNPPPDPDAIAERLRKMGDGEDARISLIPGDFQLVKYSLIDNSKELKHAEKYFKRFISNAKKFYDIIVLDCNPSSSFITKCALENSSVVISPVKTDKYSIIGVELIDQLFDYLSVDINHFCESRRQSGPQKRSDDLTVAE